MGTKTVAIAGLAATVTIIAVAVAVAAEGEVADVGAGHEALPAFRICRGNQNSIVCSCEKSTMPAPTPTAATEVSELLQDVLRMNPSRPESYFPLGYASVTLDLSLEAYPAEELDQDLAIWHQFGAAIAKLRSNRDQEGSDRPDFAPLLQNNRIAQDLLPFLLKQSLASNDLEESVRILEVGIELWCTG